MGLCVSSYRSPFGVGCVSDAEDELSSEFEDELVSFTSSLLSLELALEVDDEVVSEFEDELASDEDKESISTIVS